VHGSRPEAILIATVMIGTAQAVLNVPDRLLPFYRGKMDEFEQRVRPRLSQGDESLADEFPFAVSRNRASDPAKSAALFRSIPTRNRAETHRKAYDALLLVPVHIDNIHVPTVARENSLGIDVDSEYAALLKRTCNAYTARFASES
jgi:hypothetical protein